MDDFLTYTLSQCYNMGIKNIFTSIVIATSIASCSTVKDIPVDRIQHDSIYAGGIRRDSIIVRDSINTTTRGDTVFTTKHRYIYRDRVRIDTFCQIRHDTITKVLSVEKELSSWQKRKIAIGDCVIWSLPLLLLIILLKRLMR